MIELAFRADRQSPEPVYRQLAGYLRGLVETERLPAGTRLPATRELASALDLGRVTVVQAFDELARAGFVRSHVGRGTFVAARTTTPAARPATPARRFVWSSLFAQRARLLALPRGIVSGEGLIRYDFRGGQVDCDSLPAAELRHALALGLRRFAAEMAGHPDPYGWPPLRREIARLLVARGIESGAEEIAVVAGAQQAIDLAARTLVDPGDSVAIEQPGYFGAALAFQAAQANLVGIPVDSEGLVTDDLERVLRARRVKLVYSTAAAQSPTGVVMSEARRRDFLHLADSFQTPILEDDYAAELRYRAPAVRALKANDRAGQVIYAGTFSKVLFPTLRVGFVVAPRPLLGKMALARWNADGGAALLPQIALTTLIRSGALERHLRRLRKIYAARLDAMLAALSDSMPSDVRWIEPAAGHSVWLTLPGVDGEAVFRAARAEGIAYTRGDAFRFDGQGTDNISLSFANHGPDAIAAGVSRLAAIVRRELRGHGLHRGVRHTRRGETKNRGGRLHA